MSDWKSKAIEAHEEQAKKDGAARQEKLDRVKERSRLTFAKYLSNCGVPFTDADIQFEVTKQGEVRTFIVVDGIELSTRKNDFQYEGCGVVHVCDKCGTRIVSYTINSPAELGRELTNPTLPYHRCEPFPPTTLKIQRPYRP